MMKGSSHTAFQSPRRFKASYTQKDLILYALGVGCSISNELQFLFEGHPQFSALPCYYLALPFKGKCDGVVPFPPDHLALVPDAIDAQTCSIIHLSQSLEIFHPLDPAGSELDILTSFKDFFAMGKKGTGLVTSTEYYNARGEKVAEALATTYLKGFGSAENSHSSSFRERGKASFNCPDKPADWTIYEQTSPNQAALYRLSGDYNHIHICKDAATNAKLDDGPILHGLCTLGIVMRVLWRLLCIEAHQTLQALEARFLKPLHAGDCLQLKFWKVSESEKDKFTVFFQASSLFKTAKIQQRKNTTKNDTQQGYGNSISSSESVIVGVSGSNYVSNSKDNIIVKNVVLIGHAKFSHNFFYCNAGLQSRHTRTSAPTLSHNSRL